MINRVNINKNKEEGITTMKKNNLKMIVATSVLFLSGLFAKEISGNSGISSAKIAEGMERRRTNWGTIEGGGILVDVE